MTKVVVKPRNAKNTIAFKNVKTGDFFVFNDEHEELLIKTGSSTIFCISEQNVEPFIDADAVCCPVREVYIEFTVNR